MEAKLHVTGRRQLPMRTLQTSFRFPAILASFAVTAAIGLGQEYPDTRPPVEPRDQQAPATGGWRRVTDPPPAMAQSAPAPTPASAPEESTAAPAPSYRPLDAYGQNREAYPNTAPPQNSAPPQTGRYPARPDYRSSYSAVPPELTIRPGTYLTVRMDQMLSSDHNRAGDGFSATLVKPLVIDGVVVAERGQTLGGRVAESQKGGRVEGVSRLGVELIDLPLVDGQQLPIKTQFVGQVAGTSVGRDLGAVASTTALGAATGAMAAGGFGAGIGAASGAVAGLIGVLVTRGHPAVIDPESVVTFRIEQPVVISTVRAPQAFRFVSPQDYERADALQQRSQAAAAPRMVAPAPYYGGYYGGFYGYPYWGGFYGPGYYWGPSIGFYYGRGYYGGGHYYGGGGHYAHGGHH